MLNDSNGRSPALRYLHDDSPLNVSLDMNESMTALRFVQCRIEESLCEKSSGSCSGLPSC